MEDKYYLSEKVASYVLASGTKTFKTPVETVVLLHDKKVDGHIGIDLDTDKLESTGGRATYIEIKDYIKDKYGYSIPSLYIVQVKDKLGMEKRDNYNHGSGKG